MRICSPHCGIDPETTSGGETYERELLLHLARQGHRIDILLARHQRHSEGVENWVVHRLPLGRGLRWPLAAFVFPPAIRRVHHSTGFDLLRAHSVRFTGPAALIARRRYGIDVPIVAHHHHLDPDWLNPVVERRVMRGVDRVIVGSDFGRRQAADLLDVPLAQFSVAPYGVDTRFERREPPLSLRRRLALGDGPVVLFLGGLKRRKNLPFLLDLWREVAREHRDAVLLIAGAGPLAAQLARDAGELARERRVVFTGFVAEQDKVDVYSLADVFISPSLMEGFGLAVAEAMSCEVPVVVSNRGSLPELVPDEEGGFLCDPEDRDAFVRRLLLLLGDAMLRRKLGGAGRARIDRLYRWERCAAVTARIYEEVLDGWRRRPPAR